MKDSETLHGIEQTFIELLHCSLRLRIKTNNIELSLFGDCTINYQRQTSSLSTNVRLQRCAQGPRLGRKKTKFSPMDLDFRGFSLNPEDGFSAFLPHPYQRKKKNLCTQG